MSNAIPDLLLKFSSEEKICFKCKEEILPQEEILIFPRNKNKLVHNTCFQELKQKFEN